LRRETAAGCSSSGWTGSGAEISGMTGKLATGISDGNMERHEGRRENATKVISPLRCCCERDTCRPTGKYLYPWFLPV
jgi:hypothetical protein